MPTFHPRFPMANPPGRRGSDGRDRADNLHLCPSHPAVHFNVPTAAGRQIFSVHGCGQSEQIVSPRGYNQHRLAEVCSDSGPVIAVFAGRDGKYFTDYGSQGMQVRGMYEPLDELSFHMTRHENHQHCSFHSSHEGHAKLLQQSDVMILGDFLDATTLEESSGTDTIWVRREHEWSLQFYTRMDHGGSFHTYPHVGGPFRSLDEVCRAFDRYLSDRLHPRMHMECTLEMAMWRELHWPDGTRKNRLKSLPVDDSRRWELQLVQALTHKYNDDHNLLENLAYELQDVVHYRYFHNGDSDERYYHINFTAKTKGASGFDCGCGVDNLLFFAEAIQKGRDELVVSCICRVDPSDNENGHCYACSGDLKHPKADEYIGGQSESGCLRGMFRYDGPKEDLGHTVAELDAEEASVRRMYKDLADPHFMEILRTPMENIFPPEVKTK